jgi:hypothetical protein
MCKRDYDVGADLPNHKTDPQEIIPYGDNRGLTMSISKRMIFNEASRTLKEIRCQIKKPRATGRHEWLSD